MRNAGYGAGPRWRGRVPADWSARVEDANINHQTATFRQVNKDKSAAHHDALEFPHGRTVLLTLLCEGVSRQLLLRGQ